MHAKRRPSTHRPTWVGALVSAGVAAAVIIAGLIAPTSAQGADMFPVAATADVIALGDSVPDGTSCNCTPYPETASKSLWGPNWTPPASVNNLAAAGWKSSTVLAQVNNANTANALRNSRYVIIQIGANDFNSAIAGNYACRAPSVPCYQPQLAQLQRNLTAIVKRVRALQQVSGATVVVMGYWNVFTDGVVGRRRGATYMRNADALTRQVNRVIDLVAIQQHIIYADAYQIFKAGGADPTPYLASDGMHPNAKGHAKLAASVVKALKAAGRA